MVEISCDFSKENAHEHENEHCPHNENGRCTKDYINVDVEPAQVGMVLPYCGTGFVDSVKLSGQVVVRMPFLQNLRRRLRR